MFSLYFINNLLILVTMTITVNKLPCHYVNNLSPQRGSTQVWASFHPLHFVSTILPLSVPVRPLSLPISSTHGPKFYGNSQNKEIRTYHFYFHDFDK